MNQNGFMREALEEALRAYGRGECPVGAVIVHNGSIIARAGNQELELHDPTAHAEIQVLRQAGAVLSTHTFPDCKIYTTLWPCPMCENAMLRAKVPEVICGARSFSYIYENTFDTAKLAKVGPTMEEECRGIFMRWLREPGREMVLKGDTWV